MSVRLESAYELLESVAVDDEVILGRLKDVVHCRGSGRMLLLILVHLVVRVASLNNSYCQKKSKSKARLE